MMDEAYIVKCGPGDKICGLVRPPNATQHLCAWDLVSGILVARARFTAGNADADQRPTCTTCIIKACDGFRLSKV